MYMFPLDEGCAVYDFQAVIGGREIKGVVEEKRKAADMYRVAGCPKYMGVQNRQKYPILNTTTTHRHRSTPHHTGQYWKRIYVYSAGTRPP